MSKHADQKLTPARLILGFAAAVLVVLVGWIVIRSGGSSAAAEGEPLLVQPSAADLQAVENHIPLDEALATATASPGVSSSASPSVSVSVSPSASASASASPGPSASRSPSAPASAAPTSPAVSSPIPEKTTTKAPESPKPTRTTAAPPPPPPADNFEVTYSTTAQWWGGFIAGVRIENVSSESRDYTVTISYPSGSDIRVYGAWNTRASGSGDQVTLTGTVRGGGSISAGFQGGKNGDRSVKSPGCSVGGGSCRVS
ncbi:cellulose binding domain-containing protein [Actinoplanes sp. NPDC023714]|uniref:cellulose binding domain-containing protein n=1 Tax=Actinoplanes sp. NPDC023714 TaxID=3154322 RepID=UPI0033F17B73